MAYIRGPFAEILCHGCNQWISYNLGGTRHAEKRMDEIRELPRWYCATCEQWPSTRTQPERTAGAR